MALNSTEVFEREYHFEYGADPSQIGYENTGTGAADFTGGPYGVKLSVAADADHAWLNLKENLVWPLDDIISIEFLCRVDSWHSGTSAYVGVGSAWNADPELVATHAFFKISGGTNGRDLSVITDDGVNDLSATTGFEVPDDSMVRMAIDFKTGIQSISPPSASVGGKGSVQFTATTERFGQTMHLGRLDKHMDMSNSTSNLQLLVGIEQSGAPGGTVALYVKNIRVRCEQPT